MADDKVFETYVIEIIRFYLGEKPTLKNVPTWKCAQAADPAYVSEHLAELVVKSSRGGGVKDTWALAE